MKKIEMVCFRHLYWISFARPTSPGNLVAGKPREIKFTLILSFLKEQGKRQKQVLKVCEKFPEIKVLKPSKETLIYLAYLPKYNMLLCRVTKCGTTSWAKSTLPQLAPKSCLNSPGWNCFRVKSLKSLSSILHGNPYSIVTVRHPYERLVSGKDFKQLI